VAAAAGVGKGTLYIYFESKEDLHSSLLYDGFTAMFENLRLQLEDGASKGGGKTLNSRDALRLIVGELVKFAVDHPYVSELMRLPAGPKHQARWAPKHHELRQMIETVIRRGVRRGELRDPRPDLTALCVPGLVRSLFLFQPPRTTPQTMVD